MNASNPKRPLALAIASGALVLAACNVNEKSAASGDIDLFPKPLGEKIIPLEQETFSHFHYVETDPSGGTTMRVNDLILHISKRSPDLYGYAFEDPNQGYLLVWNDGGANRDSAGIYIAGTFRDTVNFLDSVPVLWLPQLPKLGTSWFVGAGRKMELVSADTAYFTETLFYNPSPADSADLSQGFQRHSTVMFRETKDDTLTYYYFRRGVGLLGFERSVAGALQAAGTITSFYGRISGQTVYPL